MISNSLNILHPLPPVPPLPWQGVARVALVIYISLYIFFFSIFVPNLSLLRY